MKKSAAPITQSQRRAKARMQRESGQSTAMPVEHPNAAGIDIAVNDDLWVAVGEHAAERPVRAFSPRTAGLRSLCAWLGECKVDIVAIEATGSYWLSLYLELRKAGFAVVVVNPRAVRVLKRKTDISDCQWLRYLLSVGLLKGSFVPAEEFLALRRLSRQRENLLRDSGEHLQRLQKALDEMNIHIHHVIDDVMGVTGRAIIEAILGGERDPHRLAALRNHRIKADERTVAESLEGAWCEESLLIIAQEYATCEHLRGQVAVCDEKLMELSRKLPARLSEEAAQTAAAAQAEQIRQKTGKLPRKRNGSKNQPAGASGWGQLLHQLFGVDLTLTPGVSVLTLLTLLSELGADWSCFPSAGHFSSWLGLCPEHRISGGKVLSRSTRTVQNRVRNALKMCAQSLWSSNSHLGEQYRRLRARLGPAKANTAMAHKLARILWHQVQMQDPYNESFLAELDKTRNHRAKIRLAKAAAQFGYDLVPRKEAA